MSSSVAGTSTNDVTSTDNHSLCSAAPMVITTDVIRRECVRLGLYRNPVCNDKLYLHGKGFDSVDPTAFDPYTDVKVLWLEGNAIGTLACGTHYVQTRPPKRRDPFASGSEPVSEKDTDSDGEDDEGTEKVAARTSAAAGTAHHVDPMANDRAAAAAAEQKRPNKGKKWRATLPDSASVKAEEKDIFSSLYPTVRHVYLHNNVFRVMPDLHRFQRLNTVNLANNFFASVEPGCPEWHAAQAAFVAERDERRQLAESVSKSAARERRRQDPSHAPASPADTPVVPADASTEATATVAVVDPVVVAEQRRLVLDAHRRYADAAVHFCPHASIAFEEGGGDPKVIDDHLLRTCSSVRTLNLAGNQIEDFEDYVGLLCYKALSSVDLSQNQIKDGELLLLVLERLPGLLSLKLSGNPCVRTLARYRKRVLAACPKLMTLDDRPVFDDERRLVTAWAEGGDPAEAKARQSIKEEKEHAQQKRLDDFRALLARHRTEDGGASDAYVDAISTPHALHHAATGRTPAVAVRGDVAEDVEDDNDSVTSSETESDDARNGTTGEDAIVPACVENTVHTEAAAGRDGARRVLSSNGGQMSAVVVGRLSEEADDQNEDIYVP